MITSKVAKPTTLKSGEKVPTVKSRILIDISYKHFKICFSLYALCDIVHEINNRMPTENVRLYVALCRNCVYTIPFSKLHRRRASVVHGVFEKTQYVSLLNAYRVINVVYLLIYGV